MKYGLTFKVNHERLKVVDKMPKHLVFIFITLNSSSDDEKEMSVETRAILDSSLYNSNSQFSSPKKSILSPKNMHKAGAFGAQNKAIKVAHRGKNTTSPEKFSKLRVDVLVPKSEPSQNYSTASSAILDGS